MILSPACFTKKTSFFAAIAILVFLAAPLQAVIINGGDGTGNTTAPADSLGDPGWAYVGHGNYSSVYLGNNWVLTCYHVGAANTTINGTTYNLVPNSTIRLHQNSQDPTPTAGIDLILYRIDGQLSLPSLPLVSMSTPQKKSTPAYGSIVTAIGYGFDRGSAIANGFNVNSSISTKRWGKNLISTSSSGLLEVTDGAGNSLGINHDFQTTFDSDPYSSLDPNLAYNEFQAAVGDSGGGVFYKDNNVWKLTGILEAVDNISAVHYGDHTYSIDLSYYRDQIVAAVQVFQISSQSTINNPTTDIGTDWTSVQLIGNSNFGNAANVANWTWATPIDTNGHLLTVNSGSATVSIQPGAGTGIISGTGGLSKDGSGALQLGAANSFTGDTNIIAGTLKLSNSNALAKSTLNYNVGTLVFDPGVSTHAFIFGGLSGSKDISLQDASNNPIALTVGNNDNSTSYSGNLSGSGSLTKIGAGTSTFTGALSYSGKTSVLGGVLDIMDFNNAHATIEVLGANTQLTARSIVADTLIIGSSGQASDFASTVAPQNITVVPEPSTLALLVLAFFSLGAVRWLRPVR
jgi:autotransporter-associated beta strand protein